jgi:ribonuclease HI
MRNVAGEIFGSVAAIKKAIELGLKTINIYYDYMGIEMWANGSWKTNTTGTKAYANFIREAEKKISISFTKVAAHTGIPGNELADKLAKKSVGIE